MKASDIRRGYLQFKTVRLPLAGVPNRDLFPSQADEHQADVEAWREAHPDDPEPPAPVDVGLLPLTPGQEAEVFARARRYAIQKAEEAGNKSYEPRENDEVYEYGKALFRCLIGVVDAESDPRHPEPFFDEGISQIEKMTELGADGVLTLSRMHCSYQDEISGLTKQIIDASSDEFRELCGELAGPLGMARYFSLRHGIAASFTLTSARLLLTFLPDRSSGGSVASMSTKKTPKPRANAGRKKKHASAGRGGR